MGKSIEIVGRNIRLAREALGMSQTELAEKADVKQNTISNYESGQRSPGYQTLCLIANALGVTVVDLLNGVVEVKNG